jgi:hypothetical protein
LFKLELISIALNVDLLDAVDDDIIIISYFVYCYFKYCYSKFDMNSGL